MTAIDHSRFAAAYEKIAEGYAKLALAHAAANEPSVPLADEGRERAAAAERAPALPPSFDELGPEEWTDREQDFLEAARELPGATVVEGPQGHLSQCPAHHIAYKKGRYGEYCPARSDDPDWSNDKGYCRVTPKSAAAWLRKHAGAAA